MKAQVIAADRAARKAGQNNRRPIASVLFADALHGIAGVRTVASTSPHQMS
jgi:hypothetical protein